MPEPVLPSGQFVGLEEITLARGTRSRGGARGAGILDLQIRVQKRELKATAIPPWDKGEHSKSFICSGWATGSGQKVVHLFYGEVNGRMVLRGR